MFNELEITGRTRTHVHQHDAPRFAAPPDAVAAFLRMRSTGRVSSLTHGRIGTSPPSEPPMFSRFNQTPEQRFWTWFEANDALLFDFERDRDAAFDALSAQLAKLSPDLGFEFGPKENGRRELVLSAGGIKAAFPVVEKLVSAAPRLARWCFTAFRPRRGDLMTIELGSLCVDPKDVDCCFISGGPSIGIALFFHGYTEARKGEFGQVGFLMLDEALGEYDVTMKVGAIRFLPFEEHRDADRFPLTDLCARFDRRYAGQLQ